MRDEQVVRTPFVLMTSLMARGIPASGPSSAPSLQLIHLLGLAARLGLGDGDERTHIALDLLDAVEVRARQLHRADFPTLQQLRSLANGEAPEFSHLPYSSVARNALTACARVHFSR